MVGEFLSKALQPPSPEAVQNALDTLKQLVWFIERDNVFSSNVTSNNVL